MDAHAERCITLSSGLIAKNVPRRDLPKNIGQTRPTVPCGRSPCVQKQHARFLGKLARPQVSSPAMVAERRKTGGGLDSTAMMLYGTMNQTRQAAERTSPPAPHPAYDNRPGERRAGPPNNANKRQEWPGHLYPPDTGPPGPAHGRTGRRPALALDRRRS